jgi:hypothetical protein
MGSFFKTLILNNATTHNTQLHGLHYLVLIFFIITLISMFFMLVFTFKNESINTGNIAFYVIYLIVLIALLFGSGFGTSVHIAIVFLFIIFGLFYTLEMIYFQGIYGSQFLILSFFTVVLLILFRASGDISAVSQFGRKRKYRR